MILWLSVLEKDIGLDFGDFLVSGAKKQRGKTEDMGCLEMAF